MKLKTIAATLILASTTSMTVLAEGTTPLATEKAKLSYSLGAMLGERLKNDFDNLDLQALSQGIEDAVSDKKLALDRNDMIAVIQKAQQAQAEKMQKEMQEQALNNQEKGDQFLKENRKKSGVVTTDSGLQYKVLKKGNGPKASADAEVTVHYEGKTLDGKIFDSSYERGEPANFKTTQVIPGWTEALQLMPEGSTWELYIPASLAYGPGGIPGRIGPNELLTFKVELIKVGEQETKAVN
ncbi:macrophage infectivity potentiator Mip [Kistimonas scapharcae]|uniref:Peptidyl-prolyl cis-trans isomerase n=1 Tax=Kistimonas scapharcae TaxID=1036133 RepID=A0ABP8V318_9GAMM